MSERLRSLSDDDLGTALSSLDIEWPTTPTLHVAVMARATSERPAVVRLPLSRPRRILLIAAATVILLVGAAVAAKIVIDLGGVVVEVAPSRPGILPTPSIAPTGEPVTLEEAALLLGREVALPADLGRPDRVWADEVFTEEGEVARVTLAWRRISKRTPGISTWSVAFASKPASNGSSATLEAALACCSRTAAPRWPNSRPAAPVAWRRPG